jgi:DNA mismatch repair protein MutL
VHNSKDIFHATPASSVKQRITQLSGKDIVKDLITAQTSTNIIKVTGFIGRPEFAKKSQPNQYLFVNGRYFKSPLLHRAIIKAYGNLIPDSTSPSYFLFMEIEPGSMDVNIHPSKTEIKFEDEGVIFEIISACVKEAIGEGSFIPSIDFDTEGAPEIPVLNTGFGTSRTFTAPKVNYDPLFNPFDEEKKNGAKWNSASEWNNTREDFSSTPAFEGNPIYPVAENSSTEGYDGFFSEDTACANPLLVVKGKYILTTVKSGLMLIDIGRARERIYYERYLGMITSAKQPVQEQMFPETIDLDHNSYHLLMENAELTETLGFDIRPFGENCIVVYCTPATFAEHNLNIKESIDTIVASLEEVGKDFEKELKEKIAMEMVRKSTVSRPAAIGNAQAQELIDSLFACSEPNRTPQGNPVMAIITMDELQGKL